MTSEAIALGRTTTVATRRLRRRFPILVGVAFGIMGAVVVCALASDFIAPYDPNQQNLSESALRPSAEHLLGTDQLGRDIASRVVYGARTALVGPILVAVGGFTIGTILGLLSGYLGGRTDSIVMRWVDLMFSLPGLLVTVVIVGIVGGGYWIAVALLIVFFSPSDTRIVRGEALRQRSLPYVEAARTLGLSRWRIVFRHVGPNVLPIVLAYVFLDFAFALVSLSGLAFLGIGVAPGSSDWGLMLFENRNLLFRNPWAAVAPGIAIVATAASMNLIGDWVYERTTGRTDMRT
jgi:peptide/nickel transport system permease protein